MKDFTRGQYLQMGALTLLSLAGYLAGRVYWMISLSQGLVLPESGPGNFLLRMILILGALLGNWPWLFAALAVMHYWRGKVYTAWFLAGGQPVGLLAEALLIWCGGSVQVMPRPIQSFNPRLLAATVVLAFLFGCLLDRRAARQKGGQRKLAALGVGVYLLALSVWGVLVYHEVLLYGGSMAGGGAGF